MILLREKRVKKDYKVIFYLNIIRENMKHNNKKYVYFPPFRLKFRSCSGEVFANSLNIVTAHFFADLAIRDKKKSLSNKKQL